MLDLCKLLDPSHSQIDELIQKMKEKRAGIDDCKNISQFAQSVKQWTESYQQWSKDHQIERAVANAEKTRKEKEAHP